MRMSRALALFTSTSLLLAITACGDPNTDGANNRYLGAYLYGADGNMINPFGEKFDKHAGLLAGMKGTRPLTPLSDDFKARVSAVPPGGLTDYNYAGEAYDAVVIAALAAQVAGTTDPKTIAKHIVGVTTGDTVCQGVSECLQRARDRQDVAYRGVTVRSGFTEAGEPSTTSYGTVHFGSSNQLDSGKTEYLRAGSESEVSKTLPPQPAAAGARPAGAPLTIGLLMTKPNQQQAGSKARIAAARLAVDDLNANGGILGQPVKLLDGEDGAKKDVAIAEIARLKGQGVHVLIGASGSGVSTDAIPEIRKHGLVMISPSATSAALSKVEDDNLFFRTAPSDVLQARALADMIMRDGARKVVLIGKKDAYGTGLVEGVRNELKAAGLDEASIKTLAYEIEAGEVKDKNELAALAQEARQFSPDGVLVVGLTESAEMVKALANAGLGIRH
ncbi:ABC transporter substrate-binding protein [Allorhizocola rhizosphaerae]|uniref:ABC transporter substrate-binding protein n=1 Tax=Allorhizocola rhizosphaerae TaxID=1872709 RepID=UPI000E3C06DD|nr:ABC transporter substrate-binding protein [Allorhizocola rhizosphaerae]